MLTLISRLGLACLALLLCAGFAHAVSIDLRNSDGSTTPLKSDEAGAARVYQNAQQGGEHIGATEDEGYMRTVGGPVRAYALMTDVLTDTSSATTLLPTGSKTFFAKIVGTGAQSVTVTIYGDYKSTATEEFLLCTLSLTGTTEDAKKCDAISEDYKFYHAKTASISGTGATVNVWSEMGIGGAAGGGGGGAVTNAGTFVVQENGAALTALQLIDNDQTGASVHYRTSAGATEDEHEVKATAGRLFSITATNTNAAVRYLRCSNLTAANTTPGTSTVFLGVAVPGATTGAGITFNFAGSKGIAFSTALTCWLVTGAADTDVAEVAANEIKVVYAYE